MTPTPKPLYKILVNGKSCHGGDLKWSLPKNGRPGKWHSCEGDLKICENGIHLTTEPLNWYKTGCTAYLAEARDIHDWQGDKCVARAARLIKEMPHPKWWLDTMRFIEKDIPAIRWMKPDKKPNPEWKVFYGDTWNAARDAAWTAAWTAARAAAGAAAWDAARAAAGAAAGAAARAAARAAAWDAAWDAAWTAARAAAWDAARAAAGAAAGAAARAAALYNVTEHVCAGTKLAQKHRDHARKRWEVWKKGYALLCDVNGVLYVYAKK